MTETWPSLPLDAWRDTYATLHMWTQIVGKVRLAQTPWLNHSWHVTLYVTTRGLTTSPIPHGTRTFSIDFDFIDHQLVVQRSDGARRTLALAPKTVADFYAEVMATLAELELPVHISGSPNEVDPAIPFTDDREHASYDRDYANRCWRILAQTARVMQTFRARFIGKCSPTHFFWGAFDLALSRFSGRTAPQHPGGVPHFPDWVAREAYSHEVSSCGFWPGSAMVPMPAYYAYIYPEPAGFRDAHVLPSQAVYKKELGEFILPYDVVRTAENPDHTLLSFFQSTYEAAADAAGWDRAALERTLPPV
jgi:hypothetical protein